MCFLSDNIYDYYNVSQGKITIPNMDDGEEFALTDVSCSYIMLCLVRVTIMHHVFILYVLGSQNKKQSKIRYQQLEPNRTQTNNQKNQTNVLTTDKTKLILVRK